MTHFWFVIAAYALALLLPAGLGLDAWLRVQRARRTLTKIDPRVDRRSPS